MDRATTARSALGWFSDEVLPAIVRAHLRPGARDLAVRSGVRQAAEQATAQSSDDAAPGGDQVRAGDLSSAPRRRGPPHRDAPDPATTGRRFAPRPHRPRGRCSRRSPASSAGSPRGDRQARRGEGARRWSSPTAARCTTTVPIAVGNRGLELRRRLDRAAGGGYSRSTLLSEYAASISSPRPSRGFRYLPDRPDHVRGHRARPRLVVVLLTDLAVTTEVGRVSRGVQGDADDDRQALPPPRHPTRSTSEAPFHGVPARSR